MSANDMMAYIKSLEDQLAEAVQGRSKAWQEASEIQNEMLKYKTMLGGDPLVVPELRLIGMRTIIVHYVRLNGGSISPRILLELMKFKYFSEKEILDEVMNCFDHGLLQLDNDLHYAVGYALQKWLEQ